ncbi:sensor histidine kinase [Dendrosporobacter sp. 1207_IL3150]|uniref:sensor histidine kinase n=1 Tax=Dendrosporobacter sp. 1207_IL3150 TaxID=3084054 RepID=UPI002FDA9C8A
MPKEEFQSLDPKFAQSLVDIVASELKKNVNITNDKGVIIASFSKERIGQVHEAAAQRLTSGNIQEFSVSAEDEVRLRGVRRGVNVPIIFADRCVGVIGVTGDPETAAPYARLAARFVEAALQSNANREKLMIALKEKRELQTIYVNKIISIQEEERKKISRELHDETSQSLTSIIVGLRVLAERAHNEADHEQIMQMRDLVARTLEAVHHLAVELRPLLLDDLGLVVASQKYVEKYSQQYNIPVDIDFVNLSRELRFTPEVEITMYRILQEALTNIAKHANASNVQVVLRRHRQKLTLIVVDNGIGFDSDLSSKYGNDSRLGIFGMKERVELFDGYFAICSKAKEGTSVVAEIPLIAKKSKKRSLSNSKHVSLFNN